MLCKSQKKVYFFCLFFLLLLSKWGMAQELTLTGTVRDSLQNPIQGATISIEGTAVTTTTHADGTFSIVSPRPTGTLVITHASYLAEHIKFTGASPSFDIILTANTGKLNEVVVVGYGTMNRNRVTGAIASVTSGDVKDLPVKSPMEALQGKASGVFVTQSSGTPGASAVVRIRGVGSINSSSEPLYVVDGLPQTNIGWLNPNEIDRMDILKDASAAAIYGARASNGVVMITTKQGQSGDKLQITFDAYTGIQSPWRRPHMLGASDFIQYKMRAIKDVNGSMPADFSSQSNIDSILQFVKLNTGNVNGTDWWHDVVQTNALIQSCNIGISGGNKNVRFNSGFGLFQQEGTVKGSDYLRFNWSNNVVMKLSSAVSFSTHFNLFYEKRHLIDENNPFTGTVFSSMVADPITPIYRNNLQDIPSFYSSIMDGYDPSDPFSKYAGILYTNKRNPVAQIYRMKQSEYADFGLKGGASLDIKIINPLKFRSNLGVDLMGALTQGFTPKYYLNSSDNSSLSQVTNSNSYSGYFVWDNNLTFDKKFGDHSVTAMVGWSTEYTKGIYSAAGKQGLPNNDDYMRIINAGTLNPSATGGKGTYTLNSFFARLNYAYKDRYIIGGTVRRDGSSNFADGYRWGTFPSVSAAWHISKEAFMDNVVTGWLNDVKLRGSYGLIGNQNVTSGAYLSTYGNTSYYYFGGMNNSNANLGGGVLQVGNPQLQWEKSKQLDIGLDLGLFDNKLGFTVDYYKKDINNLLLVVPLPTTLGFPNNPWSNAGSMTNKGWDFGVTYANNIGKFRYDIGGNISTFKNKVTSLGGGQPIYSTAHLGEVLTKTEVGLPVGYYFGYYTDGVFQTQAEVDASPQKGLSTPGDLRYKDINGLDPNGKVVSGPDGKLDATDRGMIGNPWPDFTYGLTLRGYISNFDISIFFQGVQGNDIMNILKYDTEAGTGWYNVTTDFYKNAWNGPGTSNTYHKISQNAALNTNISNYFVEDGSYLRLKNLQIGYDFAKLFTSSKSPFSQLRFYIATQNLLTFTKYKGLDPEIGSSDTKLNGIDQGYYPLPRTFMAGVNVKF